MSPNPNTEDNSDHPPHLLAGQTSCGSIVVYQLLALSYAKSTHYHSSAFFSHLQMANGLPSPITDYSKFTVPQLKAACKELCITGYSKLGKAALLEKLSQHVGHANQKPKETVVSATNPAIRFLTSELGQKKATSSITGSQRSDFKDSSLAGIICDGQLLQESSLPQHITPVDRLPKASSAVAYENRPNTSSSLPISSADAGVIKVPSKRKVNPPEANSSKTLNPKRDSKRTKTLQVSDFDRITLNAPLTLPNLQDCSIVSNISSKTFGLAQRSEESTGTPPGTVMIETEKCPGASSRSITRNQVLAPTRSSTQSRRFVPPSTVQRNSSTQTHRSSKHPVRPSADFAFFDGTSLACLPLKPIEMPPSLSQRKRVHAWSVILSGLSDPERRQCALVSRMLRYAGAYYNDCHGL